MGPCPARGTDETAPIVPVTSTFSPCAGRKNFAAPGFAEPQIHELPISESQLARGKFPDDQLLAREPIASARQFARENFARGESAVAVAQDAIERPSAERDAEMFDEAGRFAPAERFEREDVREAVAEHEDIGVGAWPPAAVARGHLLNRDFLRLKNLLIGGQLQHPREIADAGDLLRRKGDTLVALFRSDQSVAAPFGELLRDERPSSRGANAYRVRDSVASRRRLLS